MKKLFVMGILSCIALKGYAQSNPEVHRSVVNVTATATVIDNLSLTTIRDVTLESSLTVDGVMHVSPINSPYAGLMRINGSPGKSVRITYLTSETLIDEGGSGALIKANYRISGFAGDNQNASVLLDIGEGNVRLNQKGEYFLWLGAILDLNNAGPGSYVSEFLIELEGN